MRPEALFLIAYVALVLFVIVYIIRLFARMAKAQEEAARHLYEIAKDMKAIAIIKSEKKE